jgi:putative oxidoreductase
MSSDGRTGVGALNAIHPGWGIAAVRLAASIVLIVAGFMKFGNLNGFAGFLTNIGFPAPGALAPFIATLELVGGLLLLIGLGTRWLAILFVIEFLVTTFVVKLPRMGWDPSRIDVMMLAAAVLMLLAGPGKAAVDEVLARRRGEAVRAPV